MINGWKSLVFFSPPDEFMIVVSMKLFDLSSSSPVHVESLEISFAFHCFVSRININLIIHFLSDGVHAMG